jgi:hypothetical protein
MKIVGRDLHTRYQQIAMPDAETGEIEGRRQGFPKSRDFRHVGSRTARGEFLIDHRFFHHNQP